MPTIIDGLAQDYETVTAALTELSEVGVELATISR
jgi:hypothetical protein